MVKSYNPGEIYDAIDDLETALEINPNHFGTKLLLIAKHLQFGGWGNLLPAEEIDLEYIKPMVDDVEQIITIIHIHMLLLVIIIEHLSQFDKAIESYNKLESFQEQGVRNLYTANHYRALANTFKGDFSAAESFFRKNVELGNQFGAYTWLPEMFLFDNDFDAAISVLDEFENNLISFRTYLHNKN